MVGVLLLIYICQLHKRTYLSCLGHGQISGVVDSALDSLFSGYAFE